jgi:hypothetical protein
VRSEEQPPLHIMDGNGRESEPCRVPNPLHSYVRDLKEDALSLDQERRRFAEEYTSGEHATNATRSLMVVRPDLDYNSASVRASDFLKEPKVNAFLAILRERVFEESVARCGDKLRDWSDLLPRAQAILVGVAEGTIRSRLQFDGAKYLVDRVLGGPQASTELVVRDERNAAHALTEFARRVTEMNGHKAVHAGGDSLPDVVGSMVSVDSEPPPHSAEWSPFQPSLHGEQP